MEPDGELLLSDEEVRCRVQSNVDKMFRRRGFVVKDHQAGIARLSDKVGFASSFSVYTTEGGTEEAWVLYMPGKVGVGFIRDMDVLAKQIVSEPMTGVERVTVAFVHPEASNLKSKARQEMRDVCSTSGDTVWIESWEMDELLCDLMEHDNMPLVVRRNEPLRGAQGSGPREEDVPLLRMDGMLARYFGWFEEGTLVDITYKFPHCGRQMETRRLVKGEMV